MKVFYLPITEECIYSETLLRLLSAERQNRIGALKNDSNKVLSLYSELLLRWCLKKEYNLTETELLFEKNPFGKPYLASVEGIFFNLSHTKGMIILGLSSVSDIGVDVEHNREVSPSVLKKILSPCEAEYLNSLKDGDKADWLIRLWTKKEAYAKLIGQGLGMDFRTIDTLNREIASHICSINRDDFYFSVASEELPCMSQNNINELFVRVSPIEMLSFFNVM